MKLDKKDKKIIQEIMKKPKITDSELAKKINLSRSGTAKRRKKLEEEGEIQYYASPNLQEPSKIITGIFKLSSSINRDKAVKAAKTLSKEKNILSTWVRKTKPGQLGIGFIATSEDFKDKVKTDRAINKWKKIVKENTEKSIKTNIDEVSTEFITMFNRKIN